MYLLLLLWSAAIACGTQRACDDCRIPRQYLIPITPRNHCKYIEKYFKWLKERNLEDYDTRALHYEPVEYLSPQDFHPDYFFPFSGSPTGTTVYDNRVPNVVPNWIYQTQTQFESHVPNTSPKIKRKKSFHPYVDNETDHDPFYTDISITSRSEEEASRIVDLLKKMKQLTEKYMKDCFDMHFIFHSRRQGMRIQDYVISKRNKIYSYISDDDLMVEINNKCNQLASVVTESINEIKTKWLYSVHPRIMNDRPLYDKGATVHYNSPGSKDQKIFVISTLNPNLESKTLRLGPIPLETSTLTTQAYNSEEEIITEILNDISEIPCCRKDATSTPIPTETTKLTAIEELSTPEISRKPTTLDLKNKAKHYVIITPTAFEFEVTISPNIKIPWNEDTTTAVSELLNDDQYEYEQQLYDAIDAIDKQKSHELTTEESNRNLDEDGSKITGNAKHRKEYIEGEYEITKVVTVEFSNNTIISEAQGNEKIPNLDFVSSEEAEPKQISYHTGKISQGNKSTANFSSCSAENEKDSVRKINYSKNITDDMIISGNLYFKYGTEYVPASFSQEPNGQVGVVFDLFSLCESNKKENTSLLIQSMCNCIN